MHFQVNKLENSKTRKKVPLMFLDLKVLTGKIAIVFLGSFNKQERYKYILAFKNLKISSKKGEEWSESEKPSRNDVLGG